MQRFWMTTGAALAVVLGGMAMPGGDAAAQGTDGPFPRGNRSCPGVIYKQEGNMCVPSNGTRASRKVYPLPSNRQCADGYKATTAYCEEIPGWKPPKATGASSSTSSNSTARAAPSGGSGGGAASGGRDPGTVGLVLAKSNPLQLCPSGYRTSRDNQSCQTIKPEAPVARAKGAGPCNAGEIEEFGAWCTSTNTTLKAGQIENITIDDFNRIYTQNGRRMPVPARQGYTTPLRSLKEAEEGSAAPAQANASGNAGAGAGVQQAAGLPAGTPAQPDPCAAKPKKKGLGRALGGAVGAAVGAVVDAAEGC